MVIPVDSMSRVRYEANHGSKHPEITLWQRQLVNLYLEIIWPSLFKTPKNTVARLGISCQKLLEFGASPYCDILAKEEVAPLERLTRRKCWSIIRTQVDGEDRRIFLSDEFVMFSHGAIWRYIVGDVEPLGKCDWGSLESKMTLADLVRKFNFENELQILDLISRSHARNEKI
jgi:hypothetical protein